MRTAPQLVLPVDDSAIGNRTLCLHHHGRPVRLACKLIVAHPLHAHRPAIGDAREQRSVERHVIVPVAAIASCALGEDAPDRRGFDLQGFGEVLPEREYALRMRPDGEFSIPEFGKRAGWTDRGMGEVRLPIGRLHEVGPAGAHASLLLTGDRVDRPQREQLLIDRIRIGELGAARPARAAAQRGTGLDRLLLALRDNSEEAAVAHEANNAWHCLDCGFIDAFELRAGTRRMHHTAVQHARQANVLNIRGTTGNLSRDIQSLNRLPHELVL